MEKETASTGWLQLQILLNVPAMKSSAKCAYEAQNSYVKTSTKSNFCARSCFSPVWK